ncbi:hypothetical protein FOZ61_004095 [Perkinsus olseni]|uniref:Uncharacterized protein n=1 Tax=Perkinsus olseni TaxID=32597 RepID=A0A7J6LMR5_PEROL|nr:hypothetical protein FOZ61_004095 [Perkinsus olseni]KAF4665346.1 hypothetical protein FOL46_003733 [Perkinsus olseni]
MVRTSSLLNNTFWCIGLVSCLLVYLTKAQEFRQQEMLYGQLRDGEVEYLFFPRASVPIMDPFTWSMAGLTTRFDSFHDKVTSRSGEPGWTGLHTCDLATHNARFDDDEPVNQTRILRVEGGMTLEYIADVVRDGNCFDRIRRLKSLSGGDTEYVDASGEIRGELTELCNRGLVALKPSPNVSVLDGPYSGDGPFKSVYLNFNNGSLKDADLSVWQISKENRIAMYYPLCDGVLSLITAVPKLPFEKVATYIIMKRLRDGRKQKQQTLVSREKRRRSVAHPRPLTGVSNQLCGPQHVRRRLSRSDLDKWDRGLPQTFVLKRRSAFRQAFTGVSESEV